ncbi:hypothetical protein SM120_00240 [Lactococcus lactis subsp. lactis]|uniref:Uncharacterized protein n=2 Tax=Lactococcus lactis TaxID=1358 RepID=A0AAP8JDG8_9LACT|nr:hypothetical protein [Lactococcus lactis]MDG4971428.1 hypothetical protein [Lactococcus lactis]MDY4362070.1 hypothetical protein [Lactococcus lactis subsp. lactis]PFG88799.1 hypothetical protein BW154_04700 [Lactococcus lactis]
MQLLTNTYFFILVIVVTIIFFIRLFFVLAKLFKISSESKMKYLTKHPERTVADYRRHRKSLVAYELLHLYTPLQRNLYQITRGGIMISLGILVALFIINDSLTYSSQLLYGLIFYLLGFFIALPPKADKEIRFWKNYLVMHPENLLNVTINDSVENLKKVKLVENTRRKCMINCFIIGTLILFLSLIIYLRTQS